MIPSTSGSDLEEVREEEEEATKIISHETQDLRNYSLDRDRQRRNIVLPARFNEADCISLALNVADSLNFDEPDSFEEAVNNSNG